MKKIVLFIALSLMVFSCSSSDSNNDGGSAVSVDRSALLTHWADDIIIPSYQDYDSKLTSLQTSVQTFNAAPSETNLAAVRTNWLAAYQAYQYVALYAFGKAETIFLKESANTYPASASGIEQNITSGSYNLSLYAQYDKQGFPGLDYLINGTGSSDAAIVAVYSTHANASGYRQYLLEVVTRLKSTAETVLADWNNGYRNSYVSSTGTTVSSAVNKTTNNFVKSLEKDIRTAKLGIPSGEFSNGTVYPDKVEAYYKGDVSKLLLNTSLQASRDFFLGKSFGSNQKGAGLKSYLDAVGAVRNGQLLSDIIDNQYASVFTANAALNDNFAQQIVQDNAKMNTAYDVLQQLVIYTKLDMMQALNITIDYVDGDGD